MASKKEFFLNVSFAHMQKTSHMQSIDATDQYSHQNAKTLLIAITWWNDKKYNCDYMLTKDFYEFFCPFSL